MATAPGQITLQYFDDDGDPLNAGTITVYAANTTNLSTIYSDAAGTTTDNPKTLDSAGRVDFYIDGVSYDILVKNSAGVTIDTKDDYTVAGGSVATVSSDDTININILADNTEKALTFLEATNEYLNFDTRNAAELVSAEKPFVFGSELRAGTALALGTGYTDVTAARAAQDDVTGYNVITIAPTGATDETYSFTGMTSGNLYIVINIDSQITGIIDGGNLSTSLNVPADEGRWFYSTGTGLYILAPNT